VIATALAQLQAITADHQLLLNVPRDLPSSAPMPGASARC
jgi:hypothetical protein